MAQYQPYSISGEFEFFVNKEGVIEFVVLNGIPISRDDTSVDLGKLCEAYLRKRKELADREYDRLFGVYDE